MKWHALLELLRHPWFTRLWIHQEVSLSREAIIMTTTQTMPYEVMHGVVENIIGCWLTLYNFMDFKDSELWLGRSRFRIFRSAHAHTVAGEPQPLSKLLKETTICECFEPRDCVYALLGMVPRKLHLASTRIIREA